MEPLKYFKKSIIKNHFMFWDITIKSVYNNFNRHGVYSYIVNTKWVIPSLVIFTSFLYSCDRDNRHPGYHYFPDMANSKAFETYAPNTIFADGKTAQHPVARTIPRNIIPYQYDKTKEGKKLAGIELTNPFLVTDENISRGKFVYETFCANCHGFDGTGNGNLFISGIYPSQPPSLVTEDMRAKPDGEYYHVITLGSSIMGPFSSLIRQEDKWKTILYIKNELSEIQTNN